MKDVQYFVPMGKYGTERKTSKPKTFSTWLQSKKSELQLFQKCKQNCMFFFSKILKKTDKGGIGHAWVNR